MPRSGKCESKGREEEEEEAERETGKYQKGEEKERDGEKDRADHGTRQRFVQEPAYTGNSGSSPPPGSGP